MTEKFFQVLLVNVQAAEEDLLTEMCFASGASGMAENLDFSQNEETYEPITHEKELKEIFVYFENPPLETFFLRLAAKFPEIKCHLTEEQNRDWMEEWKKDYSSFELCEGYWVVPSWLEVPAEASVSLRVDPGMAFGTGTHDTTQIAATLLVKNWDSGTVMDVGTGTGILAMLAQKLGATEIFGTEIDKDARRVARENCELNEMSRVIIHDYQLESVQTSTDWVIANIIDGVLIRIQEDLMRLTKRRLLLTGILEEREDVFLKSFSFHKSFKIMERRQQGEWVGFLLERVS